MPERVSLKGKLLNILAQVWWEYAMFAEIGQEIIGKQQSHNNAAKAAVRGILTLCLTAGFRSGSVSEVDRSGRGSKGSVVSQDPAHA